MIDLAKNGLRFKAEVRRRPGRSCHPAWVRDLGWLLIHSDSSSPHVFEISENAHWGASVASGISGVGDGMADTCDVAVVIRRWNGAPSGSAAV